MRVRAETLTGTPLRRVKGTEAERMHGKGFLPCGLAATGIRCPGCGDALGRFRRGAEGSKYFNPGKGITAYGKDAAGYELFCRECGVQYEEA